MSIDPTELADHLEIEQAIRNYAVGLDERRWELWDLAFTDDAMIDFTSFGGKRETPAAMRERLSVPDPLWLFAQHPTTNILVDVDGDEATAHSEFTMETGRLTTVPGTIGRVSGGGSYTDTLRRTEQGWRISVRMVFMKWKETRQVLDEVKR